MENINSNQSLFFFPKAEYGNDCNRSLQKQQQQQNPIVEYKEASSNAIRSSIRARTIQMSRQRFIQEANLRLQQQEQQLLQQEQQMVEPGTQYQHLYQQGFPQDQMETISGELQTEYIVIEKNERLANLASEMNLETDLTRLFLMFEEANSIFEGASDEEKAQFTSSLLSQEHLIDALKKLILTEANSFAGNNNSTATSMMGRSASPKMLSLLSKLATEQPDSVQTFVRKGIIDVLGTYFKLHVSVESSLIIFQFLEKAISKDENLKAIILATIPIQLFLYMFMEPQLQSETQFLRCLAMFLNKCCLTRSDESTPEVKNNISLYCQMALNDFIDVLEKNILNMDVSVHISEIITFYASSVLRENAAITLSQIETIKKIISVQFKSSFNPLLSSLVNIIGKIFQNTNALKLMGSDWKQFASTILEQGILSKVRAIRSSSIPGVAYLVRSWEDDASLRLVVDNFTPMIEKLFLNESKAIKGNCLDYFLAVVSRLHLVSEFMISRDARLQIADRVLNQLITYIQQESFADEDLTDILFKIIDLIEISLVKSGLEKIYSESNVQQIRDRILKIDFV